jgi:anti-sigma regulatory factor (Ser/Thr protein kinase)
MRTMQSFPGVPESVPAARRFVLNSLPTLETTTRDGVGLMVSELVTNAIVHGMTAFDLNVDLEEDELRVEVSDRGTGTPAVRPLPPSSDERGRGLRIVGALSDRWGVNAVSDQPGKCVWFELALHSNRAPV